MMSRVGCGQRRHSACLSLSRGEIRDGGVSGQNRTTASLRCKKIIFSGIWLDLALIMTRTTLTVTNKTFERQ